MVFCSEGLQTYLFILYVEIFASMLQQNQNSKGIGEIEDKNSQYADDTEIMLEGDQICF